MARVVAEMYRIENVIYVRIRAIGDQPMSGASARLLSYRSKARPPAVVQSDDLALRPLDPPEPAHR